MPRFTEGLTKLHFMDVGAIPIVSTHLPEGVIKHLMLGDVTEFRVRTLLTKEPETIAWIGRMCPGESLWDVGANIGLYSCVAAFRGLRVTAFEPNPINLWGLMQNTRLNDFTNLRSVAMALGDQVHSRVIKMSLEPGSASVDAETDNQIPVVCGVSTIDSVVEDLADGLVPNYIKIDVDGRELDILEGALKTLRDSSLKEVLCEVNEADEDGTRQLVELMRSSGFCHPRTRHAPYFSNNHYLPMATWLFFRESN